jgi:hypothetical protein
MHRQVVVVVLGVLVAVAVLFGLLDKRSNFSVASYLSGQTQTK